MNKKKVLITPVLQDNLKKLFFFWKKSKGYFKIYPPRSTNNIFGTVKVFKNIT